MRFINRRALPIMPRFLASIIKTIYTGQHPRGRLDLHAGWLGIWWVARSESHLLYVFFFFVPEYIYLLYLPCQAKSIGYIAYCNCAATQTHADAYAVNFPFTLAMLTSHTLVPPCLTKPTTTSCSFALCILFYLYSGKRYVCILPNIPIKMAQF